MYQCTKWYNTFHDDEPIIDNSQLKEGYASHEDIVKVVKEVIVRIEGGVVLLIELFHCGVPGSGRRGSAICNYIKYLLTFILIIKFTRYVWK